MKGIGDWYLVIMSFLMTGEYIYKTAKYFKDYR